jgi:hypothetical protein
VDQLHLLNVKIVGAYAGEFKGSDGKTVNYGKLVAECQSRREGVLYEHVEMPVDADLVPRVQAAMSAGRRIGLVIEASTRTLPGGKKFPTIRAIGVIDGAS